MLNAGFLPDRIVAGESIWVAAANSSQDWAGDDLIFDNYTPAGGYTLAYQFAAAVPISVAAAANSGNTGWTLTVTGAQTLLWRPGVIRFAGLVTHTESARVFAVDEGVIAVTVSPMATSEFAAALAAIEAAIIAYATNPRSSISVDSMTISYGSLKELLDLRAVYKAEVARQTGKRIKRIIRTRFT
jgi:hypothetical protein